MNTKITYIAIALYAAAYALLFSTWVAIEFNRDRVPHPDALIGYIQSTLVGLTAHVITLINSSPVVLAPPVIAPITPPPPILAPIVVTKE